MTGRTVAMKHEISVYSIRLGVVLIRTAFFDVDMFATNPFPLDQNNHVACPGCVSRFRDSDVLPSFTFQNNTIN